MKTEVFGRVLHVVRWDGNPEGLIYINRNMTDAGVGSTQVIAFKRAIIAAGSQAVRLPFMPEVPRVVDGILPRSTLLGLNNSRQCLPCMGLSRTARNGQGGAAVFRPADVSQIGH